jgi:acyl dehydratase
MSRLELPHPVHPNDRLHLERRVLEKRLSQTRPNTGIITFEHLLKNQDERIVLESRNKIMACLKPTWEQDENAG